MIRPPLPWLALVATLTFPASAGLNLPSGLRFEADVADSSISTLTQNCDPTTGLPSGGEGTCAGVEILHGTISGGLDGTYDSYANYVVRADGSAPFTSFNLVTARMDGRGDGTFAMLETCTIETTLRLRCRWSVVDGSGTGAFAGVSGKGTTEGDYDASTGLAHGRWAGELNIPH